MTAAPVADPRYTSLRHPSDTATSRWLPAGDSWISRMEGAVDLGDLVVVDLHDRNDSSVHGQPKRGHGEGLQVADDLFGGPARLGENVHLGDVTVAPDYLHRVNTGEAAQCFFQFQWSYNRMLWMTGFG